MQLKKRAAIKSYRLYFTLLFLTFGAIIAILTSVINYNLNARNIETELNEAAEKELMEKRRELADYTGSLENYVSTLRNSSLLHDYIRQPSSEIYTHITSLFFAIATTNPTLMQIRYLDEFGKEHIRINRKSDELEPEIVEQNNLQDKSHRYYYLEASKAKPNDFWHSKIDLNVENEQIEVPYKPVLRAASPVYVDQKYKGIVIINANAKDFLNKFRQSALFSVSLIDKDGEFIVHHDDQNSWSRYLQIDYNIFQDQPENANEILQHVADETLTKIGDVYVASLKYILNMDQAALMIYPESEALRALRSKHQQVTLFIVFAICLLSIPLALLLSKIPADLNKKITKQNQVLTEYVSLIDENIITSIGNRDDTIVEVSSAFAKTCGYSKEELIGKPFSMLRHESTPKEKYEDVLKVINSGQIWKGELRHQGKGGYDYWTKSTICPIVNESDESTIFTAIHQDITDRKNLEKISITDELTGLYNRRHFNAIIDRELNRSQRSGRTLSFAMMDVDHFKQYNDHYGHQKGDIALRTIGQTLEQMLERGSDYCFRLGGEEFGAIFIDLTPTQGLEFAEKIRTTIENLGVDHQWSDVAPVITISMGLLSVTPGPGVTVDEIYKMADEALYSAKAEGRNRVVFRLLSAKV